MRKLVEAAVGNSEMLGYGEYDTSPRTFQKRELGPFAFEDQMPSWLATIITKEDSKNKVSGVVPRLARLLQNDSTVQAAYLCHTETIQVYKLQYEGNHFCGYRNIQMLLPDTYTIPKLQDMIENAWDKGYNAHARIETGGVKGTRKHIGASEAQAILLDLDIPCKGYAFAGKQAWLDLLDLVEDYFKSAVTSPELGVHITSLAPMFLQRPQHSMTIIGLECNQRGTRRLLTFDPSHDPPRRFTNPRRLKNLSRPAGLVLWSYRRGENYLKRYQQFEIIHLVQMKSNS